MTETERVRALIGSAGAAGRDSLPLRVPKTTCGDRQGRLGTPQAPTTMQAHAVALFFTDAVVQLARLD